MMEQLLTQTTTASVPCTLMLKASKLSFMDLPVELKLKTLSYLDRKRDVYNFSRTCRRFEDVALTRLYSCLDLEVSESGNTVVQRGFYGSLRPHVIASLQSFSVRAAFEEFNAPKFQAWRSDFHSAEGFVHKILTQIPTGQLRSFSFMHNTAFPDNMLQTLGVNHGQSLTDLCFYNMSGFDNASCVIPTILETLECRSLSDGKSFRRLLQANKDTLRRLCIGQEKELLEHSRRSRSGFVEHFTHPSFSFSATLGDDLLSFPNLRQLHLIGIDMSTFIPTTTESALFLTQLTQLTLESCEGSSAFLSILADTFTYAQYSPEAPTTPTRLIPQLKSFQLRNESPQVNLKEALVGFLESFDGLRNLSLLFENATVLERPGRLIAGHGPTLQTLVLETRIQPREQLALDTSRPFGVGGYNHQLWEESIHDISRLCPNLVELGMAFPWNDEMIRLQKSMLPKLQHLKTIHIRNFPESQNRLQVGDYSIKEYAVKFMDWIYGGSTNTDGGPYSPSSRYASEPPQVQTLSIGPILHESRFKDSNPARVRLQGAKLPEFQRTHHFVLDWARTRFGRWNAVVTPVSEKYVEEIREQTPLSGVFDGIWLR